MKIKSSSCYLALGAAYIFSAMSLLAAEKQSWHLKGMFVEGCTCSIPCACELSGVVEKGCQGVGALSLDGGEFNGVDLSGAKIAYGGEIGEWIYVYADSSKPEQREAALQFAKKYYGAWGKIAGARAAKIDIDGESGNYIVKIDGGKTLEMKTEPIIGGDGKSPVKILNTKSKISPEFLQAKTVRAKFQEEGHEFQLEDSNSYFNDRINSKGEVAVQ